MIILDTNVISEIMRPEPDAGVKAWLATQDPLALAVTSITVAEIQRGIVRLPKGKRRMGLENRFAAFIEASFAGRLLVFDKSAAYACGEVSARREQKGLHADAVDMMIAGIVAATKGSLATRNITDFNECGILLINPWRPESG